MKEEIRVLKEIAGNSDLDNYTIDDDECYLNGYARKCLKKVLDYITTLQEENKEAHDFDETMKDIKDNLIARINRQKCEIHNLKAKLEMYENGVYFSSENDKLQERIDKAVEYIKYNATSNYFDKDKNMFRREIDLLEILGGSDDK